MGEDEVPEFVKDPLAYAEETHRMAEELQHHIFPPWRCLAGTGGVEWSRSGCTTFGCSNARLRSQNTKAV
jgi:hypothetical protein